MCHRENDAPGPRQYPRSNLAGRPMGLRQVFSCPVSFPDSRAVLQSAVLGRRWNSAVRIAPIIQESRESDRGSAPARCEQHSWTGFPGNRKLASVVVGGPSLINRIKS